MNPWVRTKIGDQVTLQRGVDLEPADRREGLIPVISSGGPFGFHDRAVAAGPGVLLGRKGTLGTVWYSPEDYWPYSTTLWVKDFHGNDARFVYYFFRSIDGHLKSMDVGSANPTLNRNHVHPVEAWWPPSVSEQRRIADTLGALDDKIESNRRLIGRLAALGTTTLLNALGAGARLVPVGDAAEFHNNRRVPLSAPQRAEMPGEYPYYGATGVVDHVGQYIFDSIICLVGEDGSVINRDGTPVVQYVWGRCWVNNHAHVLTGKGISTELLVTALQHADVRGRVTGAVQAKLSMGNLRAVEIYLPTEEERAALERDLAAWFARRRAAEDESRTLAALRDALLPELLSGRIRVPEAREQVKALV